jgi:hypothetical protein
MANADSKQVSKYPDVTGAVGVPEAALNKDKWLD